MSVKVIYFQQLFPGARDLFDKYKAPGTEITYWHYLPDDQKEACLAPAEYFITSHYPITRELLAKAPRLKMIQKAGTGLNNIDLEAAAQRGVMVSVVSGANSSTVAEMTIGAILSIYRKLTFLDRETKRGKWLMQEHRAQMFDMKGKTHGIIGFGVIGKIVAELSQAFGTAVMYFDVKRLPPASESALGVTYAPLEHLLSTSDIISLHIPLLPETKNLIGEREIRLMKPNAVIINVARGHIIDEQALAEALQSGRLLGAAMDAWASEPINPDNPLLKLDSVLATPHIAGGTFDAMDAMFRLCLENIQRVASGETPHNLVKTDRLSGH
jgi:phosphoglycerate dehydrogenase-like enzyme